MCARAYRKSYLSQVILLVATTKMSHVQEPSTANDTCVQTIDIANHIAYMIWLTAFKPNWNIQQILTHRTNSAAPVRWFTTFHTNKQTNKHHNSYASLIAWACSFVCFCCVSYNAFQGFFFSLFKCAIRYSPYYPYYIHIVRKFSMKIHWTCISAILITFYRFEWSKKEEKKNS